MSVDSFDSAYNAFALKDLKLRPGMSVQIYSDHYVGKQEAQFLALVPPNKGIMLSPYSDTSQLALNIGQEYIVRGFTGQYDFAFSSHVLQLFSEPFVYASLTYPASVQARLVRRAMRMKTDLSAMVAPTGQDHVIVRLIDISELGAMVQSPIFLGVVGAYVSFSVSMEIADNLVSLTLQAVICHSTQRVNETGFNVGLAFKGVNPQDRLYLNYLL